MKAIVTISARSNWAGNRYFIFKLSGRETVAEIDIIPGGGFRVFGYSTDGYITRRTKAGAFNLAKKQVREFLDRCGDTREIEFINA